MVIAVGAVLMICLLALNQITGWSVWSDPARQAPGEDDTTLDQVTILKPEDLMGIVPTPLPSRTAPKEAIALTPGQPWERDFRASPENLPSISPAPTIDLDTPIHLYIEPYMIPVDSKRLAMRSYIVVLAHVVERQSRGNTVDGRRPTNPHESHRHHIYTDTVIKVERVLSGDVTAGDLLTIRQSGGQIGEDQIVVEDGYPPLTIGQYMLLYLTEQIHSDAPKLHYTLQEQYTINEENQTVSNPFFTKPLSTIYAEIEEGERIKQEIR